MGDSDPRKLRAHGRSLGLGVCFLALLGSFAATQALGPLPEAGGAGMTLLVLAGGAWSLALLLAQREPPTLGYVVLGTLLLRLVALAGDPQTSDDVQRYVWEGALVLDGRSPYALAPDSAELAPEREERAATFGSMNNTGISAAYPPLTQALCALAVAVAGGAERDDGRAAVFACRLLFAALDLLVLRPLVVLRGARGRAPGLALAWGWCPLVSLEFAGAAHFDAAGILLLFVALAALQGRAQDAGRVLLIALSLAGAILVKYLPLVALVFVGRDARARRLTGLCALFVVLGFLPLLAMRGGLAGLGSGLSQYGLAWESTSLSYRFVEPLFEPFFARDGGLFDPAHLGRGLVLLVFGGVLLRARARGIDAVSGTGLALGAFLLLSPTLHPWYLCWIVPFLALHPWRGALALVALAPLFYWPLAGWRSEGVWTEPTWLWPLVALPSLLLLAHELRSKGAPLA